MNRKIFFAILGTVTVVLLTAVPTAYAQTADPSLQVSGSPVLTAGDTSKAGTFEGFVSTNGAFGGQAGADALCDGNFSGSAAVLEPVRVANAAHPLEASGMFAAIDAGASTVVVWVSEDIPSNPFSVLINTIHTTSSCLDFTSSAGDERATVLLFFPSAAHNNRIQMSPSWKSCNDASVQVACFSPTP